MLLALVFERGNRCTTQVAKAKSPSPLKKKLSTVPGKVHLMDSTVLHAESLQLFVHEGRGQAERQLSLF